MRRLILILFVLIASFQVKGQFIGWEPVDIPWVPKNILQVYTDTSTNSLYCVGWILETPSNTIDSLILVKYHNGQWEHLGYFDYFIQTVIVYHDTLFVGGSFTEINGQSIPYLAWFDGSDWQSLGVFSGSIKRLKVINDQLYVVGGFDDINGILCNGLSKLENGDWVSLDIPEDNNNTIYDVALYQNELYAAGNFSYNGGQRDLAVLSSGSWQPVGIGIQGGFTSLFTIDTFQNELYVGGLMSIQDGNAGHGIQKWDGTNWSMVGGGLQDANNTTNGWAAVYDLEVYENELYAVGGFMHADHVRAESVAKWDGTQWCGLGFDNLTADNMHSMAFYNDTMYVGGQFILIDDSVHTTVKRPVSLPPDTCGMPTSIEEHALSEILIYPNPSAGRIAIRTVDPGMYSLEVFDLTGRFVFSEESIIGSSEQSLDLSHLSSGTYLLSVQSGERRYVQQLMLE